MKNAVSNKIRLLQSIQPNPIWLQSQRNVLLLEISESGKKSRFSRLTARQAWNGLPGFFAPVFRPVLVITIVLVLIFGAGFFTVQAAKTALPGDLLYPVKIALEDMRVKISSQETQPKLQAEFVGIRAQELSQIINQDEDPIIKKEKVVEAVDKLQARVNSAKLNLNKIKGIESQTLSETAAAIITEQAIQTEKVLIEAKEKLVEEFSAQGGPASGWQADESSEVVRAIDAAVKEIQETSILAAEIKEGKVGAEVQMEVKETAEPEVEKFKDK